MTKITIEDLMRIIPVQVGQKKGVPEMRLKYSESKGRLSGSKYREPLRKIFEYICLLEDCENTFISEYLKLFEAYKDCMEVVGYERYNGKRKKIYKDTTNAYIHLDNLKSIVCFDSEEKDEKNDKLFSLTLLLSFVLDDISELLKFLDSIIDNKDKYFNGQMYMLKKNLYYTVTPSEYRYDKIIEHMIAYFLIKVEENEFEDFFSLYINYFDEYVKFYNSVHKRKNILFTKLYENYNNKDYSNTVYFSMNKFNNIYTNILENINSNYDYLVSLISRFFDLEWSSSATEKFEYELGVNAKKLCNREDIFSSAEEITKIRKTVSNNIKKIYSRTNDLRGLIPIMSDDELVNKVFKKRD